MRCQTAARPSQIRRAFSSMIEVLNSSKTWAELEVETDLQDIDVGRDAEVIGREAAHRRSAGQRARIAATKSVIVVFDKAGEPVQEGVFTANAYRPTALRRAGRREGNCTDLEREVSLLPGPAGYHIAEKAGVPKSITNSSGNRRQ